MAAYLVSFSALCLALVVNDAWSAVDLRGWSSSGSGQHLSTANISADHNMAYHIAFHFCFLLTGYSMRGIDAANVMFLQFGVVANSSMALALLSAAVSAVIAPGSAPGFELAAALAESWPWFSVLGAVFASTSCNAFALLRLAMTVERNADVFPQHTHAMV